MSETELKPFDKEVHEFRHWFYSADHRLKYNRDHPAYLAAWEAWKARADQPRPAIGNTDCGNVVEAAMEYALMDVTPEEARMLGRFAENLFNAGMLRGLGS